MAEHSAKRMNAVHKRNTASVKEQVIDSSNILNRESANANKKNVAAEVHYNTKGDVLEMEMSAIAETVKQEIDIGFTVLLPPDPLYMPKPCKLEPTHMSPLKSANRESPVAVRIGPSRRKQRRKSLRPPASS